MTWIAQTLGNWLCKNLNLKAEDVFASLGPSRNPKQGDLTLASFHWAKQQKENPAQIAQKWVKNLDDLDCSIPLVKEYQAVGPYLNFKLDGPELASSFLKDMLDLKENWGHSKKHQGEKICLDFSSPNIAKPFAIHHLRSTLIGASLGNILETQGYQVERINHLGDWGTQFGYVILAWKKYHQEDDLGTQPLQTLVELYQKISQEAKDKEETGDSSIHKEAANWFRLLEEGDSEARRLWKWFREVSIEELEKIYARMGITFDTFRGEAFYEDKLEQTLKHVKDKGLLKVSDGAEIIDLEDDQMPPLLLRKSDGATLYATRDLTALLDRWERSPYSFNLYVVASQQNLHFKQLFRAVELLQHPSHGKNKHIQFGMLRLPDGSLGKTRQGNVIFLDEVLDTAQEKAQERMPNFEGTQEQQKIAQMIGLGAVYFNDLKAHRSKDITFQWEDILSFEGCTGAYLQYAQARMNRILQKGNWDPNQPFDGKLLSHPREKDLLLILDQYPKVLAEATRDFEPNLVLNYLFDMVQIYSNLTQDQKEGVKILAEDENLKKARLALVAATRQTLVNGLTLLCIPCPESM